MTIIDRSDQLTEDEKLEICKSFIFCIDTNDISMHRVNVHHRLEQAYGVETDNQIMRYILHNLDIVIDYPVNRISLKPYEINNYARKLKKLLDEVPEWDINNLTEEHREKILDCWDGKTNSVRGY